MIKIKQATVKGWIEMESGNVADLSYPTSKLRRGRAQGEYGNISPTVTCGNGLHRVYDLDDKGVNYIMNNSIKSNGVYDEKTGKSYAIRKLCPEETAMLMGLTIEDVEKCRAVGVSDSQLYRQHGNGIVTNCIQFICEHIRKAYQPDYVTTDEKYAEKYGSLN